jgi:hypothetical protein
VESLVVEIQRMEEHYMDITIRLVLTKELDRLNAAHESHFPNDKRGIETDKSNIEKVI